jgi:hypothetical protein
MSVCSAAGAAKGPPCPFNTARSFARSSGADSFHRFHQSVRLHELCCTAGVEWLPQTSFGCGACVHVQNVCGQAEHGIADTVARSETVAGSRADRNGKSLRIEKPRYKSLW